MKNIKVSTMICFSLFVLIACNNKNDEQMRPLNVPTSFNLDDTLLRLLDHPLTNHICPKDTNLFIFLKSTDEYEDSWIYIITEKDSFVRIEYKTLPSFMKTGYIHYNSDSMQFVYYDCYQLNITNQVWDEFVYNNTFQSLMQNYTDTLYRMDMGFGLPNYLFWYKGNLHVSNSYLKNYDLFEKFERLLNEKLYPIIQNRKNNPIGKFDK